MLMRMSQIYKLNELEKSAFSCLSKANMRFPYQVIKLIRDVKHVSLKLMEGKKIIKRYKTINEIEENIVKDISKYIDTQKNK